MKKIISVFFVLISFVSNAYDFEVDGIYYNVVSLQDLTCAVTTGDIKYERSVAIPSKVTYNNRQLSVTEIGHGAFWNCESLTSVTIPNSVTSIRHAAFYGCNSLESVTIPNSVTSIEYEAFCYCNSLESVTIPNSVTSIEYKAFCYCNSLVSITIPESVTEIEEDAFAYCSSLTSINIPNSVISIGIGAFHGCRSLETISLPDSLKSISYGLFEDCRQLETLIIPGSIEKIMQFYYNPGLNNTGEPSNYTFSNCENLTNLYILNSPESLSVGCFAKIYHVSDGTLWTTDEYRSSGWEDWTNSIKLLSIDRALKNEINIVENLERLELGESITHVEVDISRSKKLSTIKCNALVPPELPEVSNAQYMNVNVYVPEESLEAYKADPVWGKFWNLQANGIEEVKIDSKRKVIGMYDMNGRGVSEDYQGLVIVRFSDGTCKKMFNHHD